MEDNFVLIVGDSLRSMNIPPYSDQDKTAPFISEKAGEGFHIENFYSNSPWTIPSHASIFSGKLPSEHGTNSFNLQFQDENMLVEYFNNRGYKTICVTEQGLISPQLGFGSSFDIYLDLSDLNHLFIENRGEVYNDVVNSHEGTLNQGIRILLKSIKERDAVSLRSLLDETSDRVLELLSIGGEGSGEEDYNPTNSGTTVDRIEEVVEENQDQPVFLFVNLMATHFDYTFNKEQKDIFLDYLEDDEVDEKTTHGNYATLMKERGKLSDEEISTMKDAYNASIRYFDSVVSKIHGVFSDNTKFIVTGDHGEVIGEHEWDGFPILEHQFGTFLESVKVPCIVFPSDKDISSGVFSQRQILDIIRHIRGEEQIEEEEAVISDYYGYEGLYENLEGVEIPEGFEELYKRKSFSVITKDYKFDMTSEGEQLNSLDEEASGEEGNLKENLRNKIPTVTKYVIEEELGTSYS
jgi:hypothetical protein